MMQCVSSQNYKTLSTVWNNKGSNVGWVESVHSDCASAELKQLGAQEWGEGTISVKNPPDWFYFLINENESRWITFRYMEFIQGGVCTLWTRLKLDVRKCGHLLTSI